MIEKSNGDMPAPPGGTARHAAHGAHRELRKHDQNDHAEQGEYRDQGCQDRSQTRHLERIRNIDKREVEDDGLEGAQSGCAEEVKIDPRGGLSRLPAPTLE